MCRNRPERKNKNRRLNAIATTRRACAREVGAQNAQSAHSGNRAGATRFVGAQASELPRTPPPTRHQRRSLNPAMQSAETAPADFWTEDVPLWGWFSGEAQKEHLHFCLYRSPSALLLTFLGEGSPTTEKIGYPHSNLSTGGPSCSTLKKHHAHLLDVSWDLWGVHGWLPG